MKLQDASAGSYLIGFEYLEGANPHPPTHVPQRHPDSPCHAENRQEANGNIWLVWKLLR